MSVKKKSVKRTKKKTTTVKKRRTTTTRRATKIPATTPVTSTATTQEIDETGHQDAFPGPGI